MKTLVLTRHAKSDWADPRLDDHDRPLNARGRRSAPLIAAWITARAQPDEALVSSARRTVETFECMAPAFGSAPILRLRPALYHADPETMLAALHHAQADTVLMIGHNPGIAILAELLCVQPPDDPDFHRYPTAATLIARFEIDSWSSLEFGSGHPVDFTVPRRLEREN